jgi:hypothetical protein
MLTHVWNEISRAFLVFLSIKTATSFYHLNSDNIYVKSEDKENDQLYYHSYV